ncbi:MAG: GTP-binding protein, partial [Betaproteobacteria bacterium]
HDRGTRRLGATAARRRRGGIAGGIMRVNLLFGFLGSGKTTLVRHLLAERGRDVKTAVIVNEFGEVGVDGDILRGNNVDIVELNSGCLCCTLKGSLMLAVEELQEKAGVERVIVEATGVAQPGELTEALADASMKLKVDIGPLVTVVDAAKFSRLVSMLGEFYVAQIENADIVILNKSDLVTPGQLEEVSGQIREINAGADILFAEQCDVDTHYLLDLRPGGLVERALDPAGDGSGPSREDRNQHGAHDHQHDHQHDHSHHAKAPAESFVLLAGGNPEVARLKQFFGELPASVWRAKGFMSLGGKPCLVQFTMGQLEVSPATAPANEQMVFIGRNMDRPDIESRFAFAKRA